MTTGHIIPALVTTKAMVSGLVDIEFCKLVMGLQSMGREVFLNSNINLATGSHIFTTYHPDPPIQIKTGLKAPFPQQFSSWDKIEITNDTKELTVQQLVEYFERSLGVRIDRIFSFNSTTNKAIYYALDKKKLSWKVTFDESGKPQLSDGVLVHWPQIRMAVQMLSRLHPTSRQRKMFETQVNNVKKALDKTKESFADTFYGPVSKAYHGVYDPEDEKEKEYFEAVFEGRDYLRLGVHCHTLEEEGIHLPCIKFIYSKEDSNEGEEQAVKRDLIDLDHDVDLRGEVATSAAE